MRICGRRKKGNYLFLVCAKMASSSVIHSISWLEVSSRYLVSHRLAKPNGPKEQNGTQYPGWEKGGGGGCLAPLILYRAQGEMAQVSLSLTSHFPVSLFLVAKTAAPVTACCCVPCTFMEIEKSSFAPHIKRGGRGESCGQDKSLGGGQWRGEGSSSVRPRPHPTISQPTNPFCPSSSPSSSFIAWPFPLSKEEEEEAAVYSLSALYTGPKVTK